MVTISHLVKKAIKGNAYLLEAISKQLISHVNLAEQLKPEFEKELGKKIKESAIIMALRRYEEELKGFDNKVNKFKFQTDLILKTNIIDFNIVKSPSLLNKIKNLYGLVNFERGDTLNTILGNNEVAIITNDKFRKKLTDFLKGEKILSKEYDMVALTIIFTADDYLHTPGIIFSAVRKLAWDNVNIYEIVSTMTELTFILHKSDSLKAYNVLQELVGK
jgi:hypothetical protein|tara:strand:- start:273 stop:929 length:657 start_codon:yes stop_codon:yes gene_type:complete